LNRAEGGGVETSKSRLSHSNFGSRDGQRQRGSHANLTGVSALSLITLCEADKPYERRRGSAMGRGQLVQHSTFEEENGSNDANASPSPQFVRAT